MWQIRLNLDLDPATLDTVPGFQEFLYLSQVYQATALQASFGKQFTAHPVPSYHMYICQGGD